MRLQRIENVSWLEGRDWNNLYHFGGENRWKIRLFSGIEIVKKYFSASLSSFKENLSGLLSVRLASS
jgi:hypothetical protein